MHIDPETYERVRQHVLSEEAKRECVAHGHYFDIVVVEGEPVKIVCANGCGEGPWRVMR